MKTTENLLLAEAKDLSESIRASMARSERRVLRVWVVDANIALRELLAQLLTKQPGIQCKRRFSSAEAVLSTLAEERPPDTILLDINPVGPSALSAIRPIKKLAPSVKVLMMTMFGNSHYEVEAFRAGASGFLLKSYEFKEFVNLIHAAHRNPSVPGLFPNMALCNEAKLDLKLAGAQGLGRRLSLIGAFRQLYNAPRRQTAR